VYRDSLTQTTSSNSLLRDTGVLRSAYDPIAAALIRRGASVAAAVPGMGGKTCEQVLRDEIWELALAAIVEERQRRGGR